MVARHQRARAQVTEAVCNLLDPSCYIGKDWVTIGFCHFHKYSMLCPHTSAIILIICIYAPEQIEQSPCLMCIVSCITWTISCFLQIVDAFMTARPFPNMFGWASWQYDTFVIRKNLRNLQNWDWLYPNCLCYMRTWLPSCVMASWFCKINTSLLWVKFIFQACLLI
jgi:hypothetical protein